MKITTMLLFAFLFWTKLFAQTTKTDSIDFTHSYNKYPAHPLAGSNIDSIDFTHSYNNSQKTIMYEAGKELINFNTVHSTGLAIEIIGLGIAVAGLPSGTANNSYAVSTIGGIFFLAGFLIELTAYHHIKIAGLILKDNAISVPIRGHENKKNLRKAFGN